MRVERLRPVAAVAVVLVLAACTGQDTDTGRDEGGTPGGPVYVALGDSAVAGAGIGGDEPDDECLRSDANYPALVARALGLTSSQVEDVSCPGATTGTVLDGRVRPTSLPAQIDAVTPDAELVTLSVGGNDSGYVPALFAYCYTPPTSTPDTCRATLDTIPGALPAIQRDVAGTLRRISDRAPDATVVLVGYLRLMADDGRCADVDMPADLLSEGAQAEGRLAETMAAAAEEAGATYVDMRDVSEGHDACAPDDEAWTSDITAAAGDGSPWHPRAVGMEAVAREVVPVVEPLLDR